MQTATRHGARAARREAGLVAIITYKFVKGVAWLILAVVLLVGMKMGLSGRLLGLAEHLKHHAHAGSIALAKLLVRAATRRGLLTIVVALFADGLGSLVEGWALYHGRWWGPWLVVASTASLLPFEVVALVRHVHPGRLALLVINLVIVVYLARKALAEVRERRADELRRLEPRAREEASPPPGTSARPSRG